MLPTEFKIVNNWTGTLETHLNKLGKDGWSLAGILGKSIIMQRPISNNQQPTFIVAATPEEARIYAEDRFYFWSYLTNVTQIPEDTTPTIHIVSDHPVIHQIITLSKSHVVWENYP